MKKLQVMLSMALLFSLLFATANVFAGAQPGKGSTFKGTVAAIGNGSLTLSQANGNAITFVVNGDTKVKAPGLGSNATLADVKTGAQATVQAVETETEEEGEEKEGKEEKEEKETWTALYIHVAPGKPEKIHRVGMVTEYVAGMRIAILTKDGKAHTFAITPDSKITPPRRANQLGAGARVAIIASRDATRTEWTARSIVIYSKANPTGTASATSMPPTATNTQLPPGMTNTPMPPTATASATMVPPTATNTQLPPTATASATMVPPTATNTQLPPTATNTSIPPTATNTQLPPTATASATAVPPTATTAPITWDGYAGPLFKTKCTMCHGTIAGVTLSTYQSALSTGSIIPGNPSGSKLVQVQQKGNHPGQLNADELAKVIAWIQAGAPEK